MGIPDEILEQARGLAASNLCDAMDKKGNMLSAIKPVYPKARLLGPAVTVSCPPGDNLTIHQAMAKAEPGSVLVIDGGGFCEAGMFGAIMALGCKLKGIAGVVLDGGCRDIEEIEEMGFALFARAVNPGGTVKKTAGKINGPVSCGGQVVHPGDLIVGDRDGVAVVPSGRAVEIVAKARAIVENEQRINAALREGKSTVEILNLPPG